MEQREPLEIAETLDRLREDNRKLRAALGATDCGRVLLQQQEEFSRLLSASKRIVAELDADKVFSLVAESARRMVNADLVLVPMLSETGDRYTYVAAAGEDAAQVSGTSYSASVGMCGWVLQNERSLLFGEKSPYWLKEKTPWEEGQQSAVLVPLFGRKGIIGGLSALGKQGGGAFTLHDLDLLTMFANQVSNAIENALLFQQRLLFEQGLQEVNACFLSFGSDPLANIQSITRTTGKVLHATCALYNRKEGDRLQTTAGWQMPPDMPLPSAVQGRLCLDALERGSDDAVIVRNLQQTSYAESDPNVRKYGLHQYVGYPVRSNDQPPFAMLCAVFTTTNEISAYQLNMLRLLSKAAAVEEERLRADLARRASEIRFRTMIENASVGILAADLHTMKFRYANPVICGMLGYQNKDLLAMGVDDIHPQHELERIKSAFSRHEGLQTRCVCRDGSLIDVDIKPVIVELDGIPCLLGFFTDISERYLLEAERLKTQKLEAIGKLAGGIAHDFNNLLQVIFGYIAVAKETMAPEGKSFVMLQRAESALQQSVNLTNQLLTFSKGGKPIKRMANLSPLITKSTQFILSGTRSKFRVDAPPDLWPAEVDEGQIGQVIQNIVLNADQAMAKGGLVSVTARNVGDNDPERPRGLNRGNYVRISVQDTGIGIPPEHISKIFDPYFTTKEKGNGLGLATSYSIVRNHGGMIEVASRPLAGSTFSIYLPAAPGAVPPAPAAAPPRGAEPEKRLRVLVLDDDDALRHLCGEMLTRLGHEVALTSRGQETLEAYQAALAAGTPFDVVILDLTIRGGMGGEETFAHLRTIDPEVTAIVSSGYSDNEAMAEYQARGFKACLVKPYGRKELKETLNALIP